MDDPNAYPLARLLSDIRLLPSYSDLAAGWADMRVSVLLSHAGRASTAEFGNHIRRSFLGALGPAASPEAQMNQPCNWDPPCTLDVFRREQLRGPRGDGLPKPYAIHHYAVGPHLVVELTVFGMACDWFHAAADALTTGLMSILPWEKATEGAVSSAPRILGRDVVAVTGLPHRPTPSTITLSFDVGVDASGKSGSDPAAILSAALRRIDGVSRWQGLGIDPSIGRQMAQTAKTLNYTGSNLRDFSIEVPNRRSETRRNKVARGVIKVSDFPSDLFPALLIGERCQIGRGSVGGVGRYHIE